MLEDFARSEPQFPDGPLPHWPGRIRRERRGKVARDAQPAAHLALPTLHMDWSRKAPARQAAYVIDASSSPLHARRTSAQAGAVSAAKALAALQTCAVARRILAKGITIEDDDLVGARLNLPVMRSTGVAISAIHRGTSRGDGYTRNLGLWNGEVIGYQATVTLRDAYFNVHQLARERIARGEAKAPMASVDGRFVARRRHDFSGVEIRFNPRREHLFRDALGRVVRWAEEVTVAGRRVFARGRLEYYSPRTVPPRAGGAPTQGHIWVPGDDAGDRLF